MKRNRNRIRMSLLIIVALLLVSCGPSTDATPTTVTSTGTDPTATTASAPTQAPTDPTATTGTESGEKIRVAYTVPTLNSAFFTTLGEGAQKAADDFGVELTFVGANLDVATQVKQVEDFIQSGVDVLIIQAADSAGIVAAVNAAEEAGIPVVTTGDRPDSGKVTTHIGFDNIESGLIGAEFIAGQLNGQGKVVELIGRLGTSSGREKSQGLQEGLSKYPGMELVTSQPANFERERAVSVMENIIQAEPQIDAVYAANDDMALGALQALKAAGRDEGVIIVGNDGIDDAIAAIKSGEMAATNATPPYRQGYMGVQVAHRIATGQPVPAELKEKNELITQENVDQAETIMKGVDPANRYWEEQFTGSGSTPAPTQASGTTPGQKIRVAYTVPTLNSAFFTTLGEGAQKAADDFDVELTFVGANLDVATQVKQVEDFIQSGVDVLIIQAADSAGIVAAVNAAEEAGIPVVTTGDRAESGKITTHIGFDNIESGTIGAEFIGEQLNGQGKVVELIGRLGTSSGREKSQGLQDGLSKFAGMELVTSQPANFERERAVSVMENIIQAEPQIDAVYAANDDMALGALQALKAAGRDEGVIIVGNDGIDDAIAAIKSGDMAATIATPPYRQGYMGVQIAHRIATGQPVPAELKEKNELITAENVDQAETIMKGVDPANRYWEEQFPDR